MVTNDDATVTKTGSLAVTRYAAPELIEHNDASVTKYSDTFSFGMLMLECITEAPPFSDISREAEIIHVRISKKKNPARPDGERCSDGLWELMCQCWTWEPNERPSMDHVHHVLGRA